MNSFKLKLWFVLTLLGLLGVVSLLFATLIPAGLPPEITEQFSPLELQLLSLINPAILVIIFTTLGVLVYDKVQLSVPIFERLLKKEPVSSKVISQSVKTGLLLGTIAGIAIITVAAIFEPLLPDLGMSSEGTTLPLITRLLYGGISEELITRFGLMSVIAWILYKLTTSLSTPVYWAAIVLASLVFALGHLPVALQSVAEPNTALYAYILLGNSVGGILFGYAYLKRGLESAFIAHAFAHVIMLIIASIFLYI